MNDPHPADAPAFDPEPWRTELQAFLRRLGAHGEADDIVQETFLRSLLRPPLGAARPWLFGIARNLLRDRKRAEKRAGAARERVAERGAAPDPALAAERGDLLLAATRAMEGLSRTQRLAIELRVHRHASYAEVGAALGCTEATARQHVYLGMRAIRAALAGDQR